MKKALKASVLIAAALAFGCAAVACDGDKDPENNKKDPPAETTYSVTYDLNGGTGTVPTDSKKYKKDDTVTLATPGDDVVYTGWTFNCWSYGGQNYEAGSSTFKMPAADVVFKAVWDEDESVPKYTVTLKSAKADGTFDTSVIKVVKDDDDDLGGTAYTFPENPFSKEGYRNTAWKYSNPDYDASNPYEPEYIYNDPGYADYVLTGDLELTAFYCNVYTEKDGGEYANKLYFAEDGKAYTYSISPYSRYEYEIKDGIATLSGEYGSSIYKLNDTDYTYLGQDYMQDYTLTANDGTEMTFDGFGVATIGTHKGTYTVESYELKSVAFEDATENTLVITYEMGEYSARGTLAFGADEVYTFGEEIPEGPFTITYEVPAGQSVDGTESVENYGDKITLPTSALTNADGLTVYDWKDENGKYYAPGDQVEVKGNMTFTAVFYKKYTGSSDDIFVSADGTSYKFYLGDNYPTPCSVSDGKMYDEDGDILYKLTDGAAGEPGTYVAPDALKSSTFVDSTETATVKPDGFGAVTLTIGDATYPGTYTVVGEDGVIESATITFTGDAVGTLAVGFSFDMETMTGGFTATGKITVGGTTYLFGDVEDEVEIPASYVGYWDAYIGGVSYTVDIEADEWRNCGVKGLHFHYLQPGVGNNSEHAEIKLLSFDETDGLKIEDVNGNIYFIKLLDNGKLSLKSEDGTTVNVELNAN
ncbi:MAG: InlB B-repeat-containing protein [Clostridiales bacterium]|nr:InlB B-repeat-containing protein [Clostridiales bacterium]